MSGTKSANHANQLKRMAGRARAEERSRLLAGALADAASERGLLDVAIGTVDSPIGWLLVAVTERGLSRVAFEDEDRDAVLRELARGLSPRILESARATQEVRRELDEFFASRRRRFDLAVDLRLVGRFARLTLAATSRIPFGARRTYRQLAEEIGSPRAARAVGNALGSNPIPIVIPCHRVVRTGGALGGYAGGPGRKAALLAFEGWLPETVREG